MEYVITKAKSGTYKGYQKDEVNIFKGITYAAARRFHSPKPVEQTEGIIDATNYGYVCPLIRISKPNGELAVEHRYWPMDEDCLNLNIWTPGCDGKKRPVLFWLHGGGFTDGSSIEQLAYDGAAFAKHGDAVVVSINHRLNILGFLDLSEYGEEYKNSGNAGLEDIVCALRWVNENIEAFGGDKEQVTLMGQSGGGAKVTCMLQTPAADGLYARGINMSGVIPKLLPDLSGSTKPLVDAMMKELGIDTISQLEKVSYTALFEAYRKHKDVLEKQGVNVGCCPVKNDFYYGDPVTNGFRKETAKLPLVVGTCYGEFSAFAPVLFDRKKITEEESIAMLQKRLGKEALDKLAPLFKEAYPGKKLCDLLTLDGIFRAPAIAYIKERSAHNACTYSYLFDEEMPLEGGKTPWHCADIPFAFHNADLVTLTRDDPAMKEIETKEFGWVNAFLHTGNPNCDALPAWSACTPTEESVMVIGSKTEVKKNYDHTLISVFSELMGQIMVKAFEENADQIQH